MISTVLLLSWSQLESVELVLTKKTLSFIVVWFARRLERSHGDGSSG